MSSQNPSPELCRDAAALLHDAVFAVRNRGHTREHALVIAAAELGIRLRRARALLYGDPVRVDAAELARIRTAFLRFLDAEAASLSARSAESRKRMESMLRTGS